MQNKIAHAAERKAFELVLDGVMKYAKKDRTKGFVQVVNAIEKVLGDVWSPQAYESLRKFLGTDSKWSRQLSHILDTVDPFVLKTLMLNAGYEGGFRGFRDTQKNAEKYGCSIPYIVLFDPTSACNLHCTGCWAAEYGKTLNLSFEDMDSLVSQAKELGTHNFFMTGGEPMVRKADIVKLAEKHRDCAFMLFTNGTLIDDAFCQDMKRLGNIWLSLSIEGFEEATDSRRGKGTFKRVMAAMDKLHSYGLVYGTSICYTSVNYKDVTSDEFLDFLISKGVLFSWYFHYMPVGNDASTELLLTPEQREYMYHRIREIRDWEGGKPIFTIDFQNDGEFVGGCIAGGKYYCHVNANGDVEPCVFIHYSSANIHNMSWIDCLRQPLFLAYQKNQPFNDNMLRPCPMLENPEKLVELVHQTGAVSTDLLSPESCEHLCGKCTEYAKNWQPCAQHLWETSHPEKVAAEKVAQ
ncbi:MAG: Radical SAM core domain-containing protein [Thermocaproicibacter melissae]|jgi:MoaA/NifB/PqqE/SkfB family radical SAM enzyme|uniref:radical SAM protein n=1 Tax=Thermocaproicibacter melissae TaxID=2966552 RepID=UPI0024B1EF82|nr:radical SAM protein [Thermocaproicibacter melissae]WBY63934.1 radical SAM protein [Thermocaproicibacter melissae]